MNLPLVVLIPFIGALFTPWVCGRGRLWSAYVAGAFTAAALLVLLPLIFKWPTNQALDGAALLTALFALPSFWRVGGPRRAWRSGLRCAGWPPARCAPTCCARACIPATPPASCRPVSGCCAI